MRDYRIWKGLITFLSILFIFSCGRPPSTTVQESRQATIADRVFSPINYQGDDHNQRVNALIDIFSLMGSALIWAENRMVGFDQAGFKQISLVSDDGTRIKQGAATIKKQAIDSVIERFEQLKEAGPAEGQIRKLAELNAVTEGGKGPIGSASLTAELDQRLESLSQNTHANAIEIKNTSAARKRLAAMHSQKATVLHIGKAKMTSATLRTILEQSIDKNLAVRDVVFSVVDKPDIGMGRRVASRIIYVVVVLDLTNDLVQGFDHQDVGYIQ